MKHLDYIKCVQKRIELAKQIFIKDIEQGHDVFIPRDLTIELLPMSFQFYDPIMIMTQTRISDDRKEYFIKQKSTSTDPLKKYKAKLQVN